MAAPFRPVPSAQLLAFGQRVCAYIGVSPEIVVNDESFDWEVYGGDKLGFVQFKVALPAEDILAMFNGEEVPSPRPDPLAAVREVLKEMQTHGDPATRLYYGGKLAAALGESS